MVMIWLFIENTIKRNSWHTIRCKFLIWYLFREPDMHPRTETSPSITQVSIRASGSSSSPPVLRVTVLSHRLTLVLTSYPKKSPKTSTSFFLIFQEFLCLALGMNGVLKALVYFSCYIYLILFITWSVSDPCMTIPNYHIFPPDHHDFLSLSPLCHLPLLFLFSHNATKYSYFGHYLDEIIPWQTQHYGLMCLCSHSRAKAWGFLV